MTLAGQVGGPLVDRIYRRLKAKNGGVGEPEFRLPLLMASSLFLPIGLIIYGFSSAHKVQWIVPNIGLFFVGLGMMSECSAAAVLPASLPPTVLLTLFRLPNHSATFLPLQK